MADDDDFVVSFIISMWCVIVWLCAQYTSFSMSRVWVISLVFCSSVRIPAFTLESLETVLFDVFVRLFNSAHFISSISKWWTFKTEKFRSNNWSCRVMPHHCLYVSMIFNNNNNRNQNRNHIVSRICYLASILAWIDDSSTQNITDVILEFLECDFGEQQ